MKLNQKFYLQKTEKVARDLLGKRLVHIVDGKRSSGIIVETEAYLGVSDPACHSYQGRRTPRTETMYLEGGHSYVYFIYGMHYCFNVVTRKKEIPEAVLIRALEPEQKSLKTNGPARLCKSLKIDKSQNGLSLLTSDLWIEDTGVQISKQKIIETTRIGVDYAGEAARWPLRFYVSDSEFVSKK